MLRVGGDKIPSSTSRIQTRNNSGHGAAGLADDLNVASDGQHGSSIGEALPNSSGLKRQHELYQLQQQKGAGTATQTGIRNIKLGQGPGSQGGSSGNVTGSRAHS